ncbi:MAG: phosphoadenosine phosphosulfate reductase family protein [Bacteroidales bacterium]
MNKVSVDELNVRLKMSLYQKIDHAVGVIEQFYNATDGKMYISFSGGKDSTVLLHLVRMIYPSTKAMYIKSGNDYPEMHKFVNKFNNVDIVRPTKTMKHIIHKYGFPLVSKEMAMYIYDAKHTKSEKMLNLRLHGIRNGVKTRQGCIYKKWIYLVNADFDISHKCCKYLKKEPARLYEKRTGLYPILGNMATESSLRKQQYLKTGCNILSDNKKVSYPLSLWTEDDIWAYIRMFNLDYCELYDKGYERTGCMVCGFGAHLDKDRFERLRIMYPKVYQTFMSYKNNNVTFKDALSVYLS